VTIQADVRRICLALPEVIEDPNAFRFFVAGKQFAWVYPERVDPKRARVPNPDVLVVWVGTDLEKQSILAMDPRTFFTTSHYDGYPAVLVHLRKVRVGLLTRLLTDAWRYRAPKRLVKAWEAERPAAAGRRT
jgi:hypothetical protein